jgi:NAD(P)-dependent dehydrogenase (short-subunit alcohol dehydrogenase family)
MIGIGLGIVRYLLRHDPDLMVIATSRTAKETQKSILENKDKSVSDRLRVLQVDITKEDEIHSAREKVESEFGKGNIKALLNVSGIVPPPHIQLISSTPKRQ